MAGNRRHELLTKQSAHRRRLDASDGPLYQQLVQTLRGEILSGRHPIGALLPSEEELKERYGVSRHTVREALRQLKEDGFITSRQGAGTTVIAAAESGRFVHEVQSINDLIAYAAELRYVAESSSMIVADGPLAQRLGCAAGARWLRIEGFRYREGEPAPVAWTEVFIHTDFAGVALNIGRKPGPIYLWIEEMYGQPIQTVRQEISACPMPSEIAPILGVEDSSAAIEVKRAYLFNDDITAEIAFTLHPAERFAHSMTLRRVKAES